MIAYSPTLRACSPSIEQERPGTMLDTIDLLNKTYTRANLLGIMSGADLQSAVNDPHMPICVTMSPQELGIIAGKDHPSVQKAIELFISTLDPESLIVIQPVTSDDNLYLPDLATTGKEFPIEPHGEDQYMPRIVGKRKDGTISTIPTNPSHFDHILSVLRLVAQVQSTYHFPPKWISNVKYLDFLRLMMASDEPATTFVERYDDQLKKLVAASNLSPATPPAKP